MSNSAHADVRPRFLLLLSVVACDGSGSGGLETLGWDGTYREDETVYRFEGNEVDTAEGDVILDVALAGEVLDSVVVDVEYGNFSTSGSLTETYNRATILAHTRIVTREVSSAPGSVTIDGRTRLHQSGDAVSGKTRVRYINDEYGVWPDSVRTEFSGD
ncbi:hypothetical protein GGP77_000617 [Salinibacter ruber]|jgi:hypothetical protein|uniref:hypothetical protein n=1 Tax=Salinibacter ruber TaxID=146919 RepID=UPI00216774A6|nr:hypothetical protein [Salinibacter ruber]MCS3666412.1 hypothetical protein [Salinibacter ruber]